MARKEKGIFISEIWNYVATLTNPDKWYHLNEIAKTCKKTPTIMEKLLGLAVEKNILFKKGLGRKIFYKLNSANSEVQEMLSILSKLELKDKTSKVKEE
jgi:hypothetical protein